MKIAVLVGTRPEVIKMSPVIRELAGRGIEYKLIHSNQHYSPEMDLVFFEELALPKPDYNLGIRGGTSNNQIGNILIKIEEILKDEKPDVLLVQGDTNTVAAGALAASKLNIKVGHIEAGLRSYDRTMPEEGNRVLTDHLSEFLFAPTDVQVNILSKEGIDSEKTFLVGNTIVDAVLQNLELSEKNSKILTKLGLEKDNYILFTAHRASNVDRKDNLERVLKIAASINKKVVWPLHLRTQKKLEEFGLELPGNVIKTGPLGYLDFLWLQKNSDHIVTDSGGLQEEACILGVPCFTIRENTERPETIQVGANQLVGLDVERYQAAIKRDQGKWSNPFGDGTSSKQIINILVATPATQVPEETSRETISVIGMGYMGLPLACLLAKSGTEVTGVDIDQEKIGQLRSGAIPFEEKGLESLFEQAGENLSFSAHPVAADIHIIAVPTPMRHQKCDLSYVLAAAKSLQSVVKPGNIVIVESTIAPGTCDKVLAPLFDSDISIVHCPERAMPGETLRELVQNDRLVGVAKGSSFEEAGKRVKRMYSLFVEGEIILTRSIDAEASKLMENTYRDVNIALANELALLSKEHGFNINEAISLANRHPRVNIHGPGIGVGGHCLPLDPWFLLDEKETANLIPIARNINNNMTRFFAEEIMKWVHDNGYKKIGILGLTYKPNVDDLRESPSLEIVEQLKQKDLFQIKLCDPLVGSDQMIGLEGLDQVTKWAEALVILTGHNQLQNQRFEQPVFNASTYWEQEP